MLGTWAQVSLLPVKTGFVQHEVCESLTDGDSSAAMESPAPGMCPIPPHPCVPLLHPDPPLLKASAVAPGLHSSALHHYILQS